MIGKIIALFFLILVLAFGGILWFDFLNVIDARTVLAPIYRRLPLPENVAPVQPVVGADEFLDLNAERLAIRLEALDLLSMEMDTRSWDLDIRQNQIELMAMELEDRQRLLDERENSLRLREMDAENIERNVEQQSRFLNAMPPAATVGILNAMDEQLAVDILRMSEAIAVAEGAMSMVSVWLSLMEPQRAADLQRLMAGRPMGSF
ncbi:MAG: flagellar protein FlbB [Spirochaetes bacterium]|nr:flagellar protein FlbB [Spirochaetota bacterium]